MFFFQEKKLIYSYLHSIKDLIQIHDAALRKLIDFMKYEYREANDVLYWYENIQCD